MQTLSSIIAARQPAGGTDGNPVEVPGIAERVALTGLVNGQLVREVGRKQVTTLTVNFGDTGGNTKTGTKVILYIVFPIIDGTWKGGTNWTYLSPQVGNQVSYANGATAAQIATAIATYVNTFFASGSYAGNTSAVAVGNVVTITNNVVNRGVFGFQNQVIAGTHAGFISISNIDQKPVGQTYELINDANPGSAGSWRLVDIGMRNVLIPDDNAYIHPPELFMIALPLFAAGEAVSTSSPDWSGVTYINETLVANSYRFQKYKGTTPVFQFENAHITNVDNILVALANAVSESATPGTITLAGANMAPVTPMSPAVDHEDGYVTADLSGINISAMEALGFKPQKVKFENASSLGTSYITNGSETFTVVITGGSTDTYTDGGTLYLGPEGLTETQLIDYIAYQLPSMTPSIAFTREGDVLLFQSDEGNLAFGGLFTETQMHQNNTTTLCFQYWSNGGGGYINCIFDPSIEVGSTVNDGSSGDVLANIRVGIKNGVSGLPSIDQVCSYAAAALNGCAAGISAFVPSTGAIRLVDPNESYPISALVPTYPVAAGPTVPGTAYAMEVMNASLATLVANSWTGNYRKADGSTQYF